ncbi:MAG TPA: COR domain-containing protein [Longimicrobium sp.]|nr:COR domain-containing protein [Longimicrobium sp.]
MTSASQAAHEAITTARQTGAITLDLSEMGLSEWPNALGDFVELEWLDLSGNVLTDLPEEIGELTRLTRLDLGGNLLTRLPTTLGNLKSLTSLNVRGNALTLLPPCIGALTELRRLDASENRLEGVPSEIGELASLTTLDLSSNTLVESPASIGKLRSLTELQLQQNRLLNLPSTVGNLRSLHHLNISKNQITALPDEITSLRNLTHLIASHNLLMSIPLETGSLAALTELHLNNNLITRLPTTLGALRHLEVLDCSSNQIEDLPASIGSLTALIDLDLSSNQLTILPISIGNLYRLATLKLVDNPLPLPPEIIQLSSEPLTLTNYYLQHLQGESRPLNEAKLLLVGEGSVGKTSLAKRLTGRGFDLSEGKTNGINIDEWHVSVNERHIRLNVWDFGGQEIMHATHQFFLTRRSVYLLVINSRRSEDENRIDYWLKMIQSFGGDSPVIVVGNKVDEHPLDIDRFGLQRKYGNIKAFVETSCKTGHGINRLHQQIASLVATLEHLTDQMLLSWLKVKSELEHMERDYITYRDYTELCASHSVTDDVSQRTLIRFLHDLGIVLNFQDDPRLEDTNVLNPGWVTGGVYQILNTNSLITQHGGVLNLAMLPMILDTRIYPRDRHMFIIEMMEKFELCFKLDDGTQKNYLIPDLLTLQAPDTGDWKGSLEFHFRYSVLPSSVMSRFIVRVKSKISDNTYWRNGVVVKFEEGSTSKWNTGTGQPGNSKTDLVVVNRALVRADRAESTIVIQVAGNAETRRQSLAMIRTEFEHIHKTIPNLEVTQEIPVPEHPALTISYDHLLQLERSKELTVIPIGTTRRISVRTLLDGIESAEDRWRRERGDEIQPVLLPSPQPAQVAIDSRNAPAEMGPEYEILSTIRAKLDAKAERYARTVLGLNVAVLLAVWVGIIVLIVRLGWEMMEPWTFVIGGSVSLGQYGYFALTRREVGITQIYHGIIEARRRKEYSRLGLGSAQVGGHRTNMASPYEKNR